MKHLTLIISALSLVPMASVAGAAPASRCAISAYVTDNDPQGTNVRAAARPGASVVARIPGGADAVVDIVGYDKGWFRIATVEQVGDDDRTLYRGNGWIHGSVIGIDVANEDPRLYSTPAKGSRVLAKLVADGSHVTLIGCRGPWAQVRFNGRVGWLSPGGQCSSPLTTCS